MPEFLVGMNGMEFFILVYAGCCVISISYRLFTDARKIVLGV